MRKLTTYGLAAALLKKRLPNEFWWLMYCKGRRYMKSPGLIFRLKLQDSKNVSLDSELSDDLVVSCFNGEGDTGVKLTLQTPLKPGIFCAFIRSASWPGPMLSVLIEPSVEV